MRWPAPATRAAPETEQAGRDRLWRFRPPGTDSAPRQNLLPRRRRHGRASGAARNDFAAPTAPAASAGSGRLGTGTAWRSSLLSGRGGDRDRPRGAEPELTRGVRSHGVLSHQIARWVFDVGFQHGGRLTAQLTLGSQPG